MGCTLRDSVELFNTIVQNFSEGHNSWMRCTKYLILISKLIDDILDKLRHYHKAHAHPLYYVDKHPPDSIANNENYGLHKPCSNDEPLLKLLWELWNGLDKDFNGLVYGKDFIIDPNDPLKPFNLISSERSASLFVGSLPYGDKPVPNIKWKDYTKFPTNEPEEMSGRIIKEAILGKKSDLVKDPNSFCADRVYGIDYIIDPNDPNKPKYLIELEKYLGNPDPPLKISFDYVKKYCLEYDKLGKPSIKPKPKTVECTYICTRLLGEWLKGYDLDNNDLVYGIDFMFSNLEPNKCICLKDIEYDLDWRPPEDIKIISWDQFLDTFPNRNPDDRYL